MKKDLIYIIIILIMALGHVWKWNHKPINEDNCSHLIEQAVDDRVVFLQDSFANIPPVVVEIHDTVFIKAKIIAKSRPVVKKEIITVPVTDMSRIKELEAENDLVRDELASTIEWLEATRDFYKQEIEQGRNSDSLTVKIPKANFENFLPLVETIKEIDTMGVKIITSLQTRGKPILYHQQVVYEPPVPKVITKIKYKKSKGNFMAIGGGLVSYDGEYSLPLSILFGGEKIIFGGGPNLRVGEQLGTDKTNLFNGFNVFVYSKMNFKR